MSGVQKRIVTRDEDGQRVDRWFFRQFPDVPKSHFYKLCRKGQMRLDSKRIKPGSRLKEGMEIRIPPLKSEAGPGRKTLPAGAADITFFKSLVLYDDGDVLALNKPSGLAVQGGTNTNYYLDAFLHIFNDEQGVTPRLVHRLDKQTSGVLLLARSADAARGLGQSLKTRQVEKLYWALTSPAPEHNTGEINIPINKAGGIDKKMMQVDPDTGKSAKTHFDVIDTAGKDYAFVRFRPHTGRTHQIRVHAAFSKLPIIGDTHYGGLETPDKIFGTSDTPVQDRLYLHARRIIAPHPVKDENIDITAPLSKADKALWEILGFDSEYKEAVSDSRPDLDG